MLAAPEGWWLREGPEDREEPFPWTAAWRSKKREGVEGPWQPAECRGQRQGWDACWGPISGPGHGFSLMTVGFLQPHLPE